MRSTSRSGHFVANLKRSLALHGLSLSVSTSVVGGEADRKKKEDFEAATAGQQGPRSSAHGLGPSASTIQAE